MSERILKDIRYYESDKPNVAGQSMPGNLGRLFTPTKDTNYIGQRIARKLNELKYAYGEFDHLYINLTTDLDENQLQISNRNTDKTIKYLDFGVNQASFNALPDEQKNEFVKSITVRILQTISSDANLTLVNEMARQLSQFDTALQIHYKTKETSAYRIVLSYQIEPKDSFTKAIIEYHDKKNGSCYKTNFKLQFYEDIYALIDTATLKGDRIILSPKKSFSAGLYNEKYQTPIELMIAELEQFKCP